MTITHSFGETVTSRVLAGGNPETVQWLLRCLPSPKPDTGPAEDAGGPQPGP